MLWLLGCATTSGLGTATTLDAGETELHLGSEAGWVDSKPFAAPILRQDVGLRHGLTDDWELGAGVGGWLLLGNHVHAQVDLKRQLHTGAVDIALSAAFAYDRYGWGGAHGDAWTVQVPLFLGIPTKRGHQWVLMPRTAAQRIVSKGAAPIDKLLVGWDVGFAWRTSKVTVMPRIGTMWSSNPADVQGGMVVWNTGCSFYF